MQHYKITFNILSWFVCMLPVVLIFSNALSDIIVVSSSLFFIYLSIKKKNYEWLKEKWFQTTLLIYLWLIITSFFAYDIELALSRSTTWIRFAVFAAALQYLFLKNRTNQKRILIITFISISATETSLVLLKYPAIGNPIVPIPINKTLCIKNIHHPLHCTYCY